jgi:hypothetical protein
MSSIGDGSNSAKTSHLVDMLHATAGKSMASKKLDLKGLKTLGKH